MTEDSETLVQKIDEFIQSVDEAKFLSRHGKHFLLDCAMRPGAAVESIIDALFVDFVKSETDCAHEWMESSPELISEKAPQYLECFVQARQASIRIRNAWIQVSKRDDFLPDLLVACDKAHKAYMTISRPTPE